jgi:hypothetical protein
MSALVALVSPDAFDEGEVRDLIQEHDGNIKKIALALHRPSAEVRKFVFSNERLKAAMTETYEGFVDEAVAVILEGVRNDASYLIRFYAAKELLRTETARRRGFGREAGLAASIQVKSAVHPTTITLKWLEPGEMERQIEGEGE